eukprot:CAMPEP_0198584246 /NCGR_PEP_ID=MMETSP1462-20131121/127785_1 /TAXON_ID=1333877 /ORGANISM="Brandtodinium nutriculum, Strain RCC3387" /LENGTH=36 /DNA_ID= /DNA_START= /DNA_END= /DNA_ORIENTATION=
MHTIAALVKDMALTGSGKAWWKGEPYTVAKAAGRRT